MANWFYKLNGKAVGPIAHAQMAAWVSSGAVAPTQLVRREGEEEWNQAKHFSESLSHGSAAVAGPPATERTLVLEPVDTAALEARLCALRKARSVSNIFSFILGVPGLGLQVGGFALQSSGTVEDATGRKLIWIGALLLSSGMCFYVRRKGLPFVLGFVGLLPLIGLIVVAMLPDAAADEIDRLEKALSQKPGGVLVHRASFLARLLAILAVALGVLPFVGVVVGVLSLVVNYRRGGWMRACSIAGIVLSLLVTMLAFLLN